MKIRAFVPGASGIIGREVVLGLLKKGHEVIAMARHGIALQKTFRGLENITLIKGDIRIPGFREKTPVDIPDYDILVNCTVDSRMHKPAAENAETNVTGFQHLVEHANGRKVFQFTTAYDSGRNGYESTKHDAKLIARGLPTYLICALPVIVGSYTDGAISNVFSGMYGLFTGLYQLRQSLSTNGHFPTAYISCPINREGALNIDPLDWTAKTSVSMIERYTEMPADYKGEFSLANPKPTNLGLILDVALEEIGIILGEGYVDSIHQEYVENAYQILRAYVENAFDVLGNVQDALRAVELFLGSEFTPIPEIDRAFLQRLLRYAIIKWN